MKCRCKIGSAGKTSDKFASQVAIQTDLRTEPVSAEEENQHRKPYYQISPQI
jgi:hypothetical protein